MEKQDLAEKLARELEGMGFNYEEQLNDILTNLINSDVLEEWNAGELVLRDYSENDDIHSLCQRCEKEYHASGRTVYLVSAEEPEDDDEDYDEVAWVFAEPYLDDPYNLLCESCRKKMWKEEKEGEGEEDED